jgi:hypothetical protein
MASDPSIRAARLLLAMVMLAVLLLSITKGLPPPAPGGWLVLWLTARGLGECCAVGSAFLALGLL